MNRRLRERQMRLEKAERRQDWVAVLVHDRVMDALLIGWVAAWKTYAARTYRHNSSVVHAARDGSGGLGTLRSVCGRFVWASAQEINCPACLRWLKKTQGTGERGGR